MTNTATQITVTVEDAFYRKHRVTFSRAQHGAFPTMVRLERLQDNGLYTFWTQHRSCVHGAISNSLKLEINKASNTVRWQA